MPNRHTRRRQVKVASAGRVAPVEDFRVAGGKVACSIDIDGCDPSTIQIDAGKLTDLLADTDEFFSGWAYQKVLAVFVAAFRALKGGDASAAEACVIVYWLALRHPTGGDAIRRRVSDVLRRDGRAHLTFHAGATHGVAIALAPRFVDLADSLQGSSQPTVIEDEAPTPLVLQ